METITKVNLNEKLELARKLGLKRQVSQLEYKTGMFDLKFKKTSWNEVRSRLTFYRWRKWVLAGLLAIYIAGSIAAYVTKFPPGFVFLAIVAVFTIGASVQKTDVENCWVDDFKHELPYGAMLALKEAGEKGILHHRVHYPVWGEVFRISDDPIITGWKDDEMYEIYAWNEEDVYEA